jgi:cell division transport system ATP-binding protein
MSETIVSYNNVSLFEDNRKVLQTIIFELIAGETIYITGPVGSGKSTFLKSLYGEKKISEGEAFVAGFNLHQIQQKDIPKLRRKLGLVFQDYQLLNDRNAESNIRFAMECVGETNKKRIRTKVSELAEAADIEHLLHKMPYELSGGEQQLISIVRALMNEPVLLIADEPTANLDKKSSRKIMNFLQNLSNKGTSVIIATHDETLIADYPARIYQIENNTFKAANSNQAFQL